MKALTLRNLSDKIISALRKLNAGKFYQKKGEKMEKGSKFKTILTTLLVLILMVGCVVLGYFVRDKEWIMIDNKNGATTLTVANVKYALYTIKEDFEKTGTDSNESGASGLAATTADSYFGLSSDLYKDMDQKATNAFYGEEAISFVSQHYDFHIRLFLLVMNRDEFNINGEIFEVTVREDEWVWGLPTPNTTIRYKCTVNENNMIEIICCGYDHINDDWGTPSKMLVNFDFTDDSYTMEMLGLSSIMYVEKDKSEFPDDFDKPAFTRFCILTIEGGKVEYDLDSELTWVMDFDLVNQKYCFMQNQGYTDHVLTHIGIKNALGETEHRRLIKEYFFDSGIVEMPGKLAKELGIEE